MTATNRTHQLRRRLALFLSLGGAFVLAGGGGLAALESNIASSYGEGVWWALSLMTMVGFVGEVPETVGGRLVSAVLMVAGFATMALTTAAIASTFVREEEGPQRKVERAFVASTQDLLHGIAERLTALEAALHRATGAALGPTTATDPHAGDRAERAAPGEGTAAT